MLTSYRRKLWIIQDNLRQFGLSRPMSHNETDRTTVTTWSTSHLPLVMHEKELWWKSPHPSGFGQFFPPLPALHNCDWPNHIKSSWMINIKFPSIWLQQTLHYSENGDSFCLQNAVIFYHDMMKLTLTGGKYTSGDLNVFQSTTYITYLTDNITLCTSCTCHTAQPQHQMHQHSLVSGQM